MLSDEWAAVVGSSAEYDWTEGEAADSCFDLRPLQKPKSSESNDFVPRIASVPLLIPSINNSKP